MRPDLVVVCAPSLQLFGRIRKRQEPVGVQALGPEAAVEGFNEGVVRRLAGPGDQLSAPGALTMIEGQVVGDTTSRLSHVHREAFTGTSHERDILITNQ